MTTPTPWSDAPPSEPGDYRLRYRGNESPENEFYATLEPTGHWRCAMAIYRGEWLVQFGPRVPTAEETVQQAAEVERLSQTLREYCDDDEVSSGFGSGCYSGRQIDEIRKRHGLDTESESA